MKNFAIIEACTARRLGCIAIICGALLSLVAAAAPAQSADLYYPPPYYPSYERTAYPVYSGYYRGCSPCGCHPCCNPCGCRPCGVLRPAPVVERHWDYWERRYPPGPYPYRSPYYPSGYAGYPYNPYPTGYTGYPYNPYPDGYSAYSGGPRPRLGFGGVQYPPGPAPISYQYEAPPRAPYERAPYEYEASARPAYDYEASPRPAYDFEAASPRPPVGMPGAYYNAGYVQ
jgi:hypothetical protein